MWGTTFLGKSIYKLKAALNLTNNYEQNLLSIVWSKRDKCNDILWQFIKAGLNNFNF